MMNEIEKKNIWEILIEGLNWKEKNFYKWKKNEIKNKEKWRLKLKLKSKKQIVQWCTLLVRR